MNDQNSQFENDYSNQEHSYSYVFSSGGSPQPQHHKNDKKNVTAIVTVVLCVCLSFAAGFGGALSALTVLKMEEQSSTVNGTNPGDSNLLVEDPEASLDRGESEPSIYGSAGEEVFAVSEVVRKVEDTVVVIDVTVKSSSYFGGSTVSHGAGSGVIISEDGYILTCNHVVEGASSVKVTLKNSDSYDAVLVGSDAASDLAVLKISPKEALTYAEQGWSSNLVAGENVVAIGNPLGTLGGTVTTGIISATERNISMEDGTVMTLIQTDTAINSGNSGGGLFNLAGELIGIVNAKYSASGVEGLAFAIPIDSAYVVQVDLMKYGYVRGVVDHGLTVLDITNENLMQYHYYYGIDKIGVYVVESKYSTELQNSDRIVSVNGTEVGTEAELKAVISQCKVGDEITIVAERDGKTFTCRMTLQEYVPDRVKDYLQ